MLERYGQLGYRSLNRYRPETDAFVGELFPWEQEIIEQQFPAPPARVLIGGAGGGREPFALAHMRYHVVAFDPVVELTRAMAQHRPPDTHIEVFRASYQDLPRFDPAMDGGSTTSLDRLPAFAAGIIGWGSFSHLPSDDDRVQTLVEMARAVDGPILVSLFFRPDDTQHPRPRLQWLRHRLPGRNKTPGNTFSFKIGLYRELTEGEFVTLVKRAGLVVDQLVIGEWHTASTHAILSSPRN